MDYETTIKHRYKIKVKADNVYKDENGNQLTGYCDVIIRILNVDEPPVFEETSYTFHGKMVCKISPPFLNEYCNQNLCLHAFLTAYLFVC